MKYLPPILYLLFGAALLCIDLSAQSIDACSFTFEPEYMGEGNCFRVILRNDDPLIAPRWVQYVPLDPGVHDAGNVEPAMMVGRLDMERWQFTNLAPLSPGTVDTGYVCFIASIPICRLEVIWGGAGAEILCRDTVQFPLSRVNNACFEVADIEYSCPGIRTHHDPAVPSKSSFHSTPEDHFLGTYLTVSLQNRTEKNIGSVELSGPGCESERGKMLIERFTRPIKPGGGFGFEYHGYHSDSICFTMDEEGWNLIPLTIILNDSTNATLCSDSVVILIDRFQCTPGGVAESFDNDSKMNLRVTGLESGEASISFTLEERSNVRLSLVDMVGNELRRLVDDQVHEGGESRVTLDTEGISSGTYILLLQVGEESQGKVVQITR